MPEEKDYPSIKRYVKTTVHLLKNDGGATFIKRWSTYPTFTN
jgi:hypothetical protein